MKKKAFAIALACVSMTGLVSFAQNPAANGTCSAPQCNETTCAPADCGSRRQCAFEGLDLTDAQKSQLKALKEKNAKTCEVKAKAAKADRQRNDSVRMAERKAAKRQYLQDVKAIVGPDQYVLFLENLVVNGDGPRHGKDMKDAKYARKHGGKAHGDKGKGFRHGDRAPKAVADAGARRAR